MRLYVTKLPEGERLEMGRLMLKAGYGVRLGKEKQGKTWRRYLEAEACTKETAGTAENKDRLPNTEILL